MKGEFENRLRQVIDEVQASPKPIILFIDEAHTLIGAGGAAGTGDAANLLKPALARGTLRTIAATTWAEYKKHIEKDPALTRRFQVVQVDEPSEDKAILMVRGVASTLEKHHRVQVLDEALEAAVRLSHRYIPARQLPDKAVSLLDTACARVAISQHAVPPQVEDCRRTHRGAGDRAARSSAAKKRSASTPVSGARRPRRSSRQPSNAAARAREAVAGGARAGRSHPGDPRRSCARAASTVEGHRQQARAGGAGADKRSRKRRACRRPAPERACRRCSPSCRELQTEARRSCRASRR